MMKRIITCSDGTWNKPNSTDGGKVVRTNVQKLFDLICKRDNQGISQMKYYDQGIGAEGNWLTRMANGATGKGIDVNIMDAYKFIVWNYEHGDDIYLFGFSRGAYTARSLAGLIRKCGILRVNDLNLLAEAYKLYRDKHTGPDTPAAKDFRAKHSFEVSRIKFIGVWDTVGSLGIPLNSLQWINRKKYSFYDTTLSSIIEHAYHAIAIDEKRGNFEPTLWEKSSNAGQKGFEQVMEQRWFAGVHSNVGGGYPDEGLADIPLNWILKKARATGLAFEENEIANAIKENCSATLYNSATGVFGLLPMKPRQISTGTIDESVYERMQKLSDYQPQNVLQYQQAIDVESSAVATSKLNPLS